MSESRLDESEATVAEYNAGRPPGLPFSDKSAYCFPLLITKSYQSYILTDPDGRTVIVRIERTLGYTVANNRLANVGMRKISRVQNVIARPIGVGAAHVQTPIANWSDDANVILTAVRGARLLLALSLRVVHWREVAGGRVAKRHGRRSVDVVET